MVAVAPAVMLYTSPPNRTLQGVEAEQFAPIVKTVSDVLIACRSPSWLAMVAPDVPDPPLVPPLSTVQILGAEHPYKFAPDGEAELKKSWPTWHVAGSVVPTCTGRVDGSAEKSTLLLCVRRSTNVWLKHDVAASSASSRKMYFCLMKISSLVI
jgi:hypothetical protein